MLFKAGKICTRPEQQERQDKPTLAPAEGATAPETGSKNAELYCDIQAHPGITKNRATAADRQPGQRNSHEVFHDIEKISLTNSRYRDIIRARKETTKMNEYRLIFENLLSAGDAAKIWGVDDSTIRHAIKSGRFELGEDCQKFGKQWVVTTDAMAREFKGGWEPWSEYKTELRKKERAKSGPSEEQEEQTSIFYKEEEENEKV